jgi:hypothetical protein
MHLYEWLCILQTQVTHLYCTVSHYCHHAPIINRLQLLWYFCLSVLALFLLTWWRRIAGSGSSYLYGFLDQAWHPHMSKDEAERFVVKSIALAIARDGASGGVVRTVTVNEHGVERNFFAGDKLPLFHEEIPPGRNSLLA